jgi:hypothetical protein
MNPLLLAASAPQTSARTGDLRPVPTDEQAFGDAFARASEEEADVEDEVQEAAQPSQGDEPDHNGADPELATFGWAAVSPESSRRSAAAPPTATVVPEDAEGDSDAAAAFAAPPVQLRAVEFKPGTGKDAPLTAQTNMGSASFGAAWSLGPAVAPRTAPGRSAADGDVTPPARTAQSPDAAGAPAQQLTPEAGLPGPFTPPAAPRAATQHVAARAVEVAQEMTHRFSDAIVVEHSTAAASGADLGMNVWADRLRAEAPAENAEAPAEVDAEVETAANAAVPAQAQGDSGSDLAGGDTPEHASTPTTTVSKPEESAARFQIPTAAVDTSSSPGEAKLEHLHNRPTARVAVAVEEIVRGRSSLSETDATARVEVEVDGQRISVRVQVRDGRVDVEIAGMDPAELAALKDDLGERLRGHELTLGDLTQDTGTGSREQREAQEATDADAQTATAEDANQSVEAARLRHDGAVYVTA